MFIRSQEKIPMDLVSDVEVFEEGLKKRIDE